MQPVKLAENIYWVGGIDWNLRDFHGYTTDRGSTYNAYLIIDEKITLIDTVKHYLADEMLERISRIVAPSKIDTVVCNHVEMDHSGSLPAVMALAKKATIVCSPNGEKGLRAHYKADWPLKVVKTGDTLSLGKRSLSFTLTPMVHWPDNMVSFCPEDHVLFSNDAFGQHLASHERFDDEFPLDEIVYQARKYYANIVLPYGAQVKKALEALSGADIRMIAPSHGIIWRSKIAEILGCYARWSSNETLDKAVIVYDTMWESTAKMAMAVASAFEALGIKWSLHDLKSAHISDIMTEVQEAKFVCVGTPTLNSGMLPTMAAFLCYLKGLAPKGRKGLAFGSYGWGGQGVKEAEAVLREAGFDLLESWAVRYIPDQTQLSEFTAKLQTLITNK